MENPFLDKKFTLEYSGVRDSDGQQVLTGFTVILAYDYAFSKVVKLPEAFLVNCRQWL